MLSLRGARLRASLRVVVAAVRKRNVVVSKKSEDYYHRADYGEVMRQRRIDSGALGNLVFVQSQVLDLVFVHLCYAYHLQSVLSPTRNHANYLVDIINKNRTSQRLQQLNKSPGLGCIALQLAEKCKGNCTTNKTLNCHPPEDNFIEVFAPNCSVELPTFH
ncbi:hypothetical protein Vadar_021340 [Vaccinium darrowii]|uniref:Uncharacterized protein n=1 Tax=Vaccinium darrowii TaxID=229202 RepID=A0ACB7X2S8_9ERIC|nr:hypothetical protein Vadar_021340 [Vaccinium darrowii]